VLDRWRTWRARRRREAFVERVTQLLILGSGYDVKTAAQEEFFRVEAREAIARALGKKDGDDGRR